MNYSKIHIAKKVLEVANIPVNDESESEIRKKAYEYLLQKDFLAAHSIRRGKNYRDFTLEDWKEVLKISGSAAVKNNIAAYALCKKHGISFVPEI